jgi:hypothetical protein
MKIIDLKVSQHWNASRSQGTSLHFEIDAESRCGSGFLLNKTPSPSQTGLKIGQSLKGLKIKPFRPGPKFF